MTAAVMIITAAVIYFWPTLTSLVKGVDWERLERRHYAAALLLAAALFLTIRSVGSQVGPVGPPEPSPAPGALNLDGLFIGPSASSDASCLGAMCDEIACEIEWDSSPEQKVPLLVSGVAIDDLRRRTREFRCRGESIGDRQPKARDEIARYLEAMVGTDGGPLTPERKQAWVRAFREIGRAASDAAK